ncbi:MAG: alpha/beta hydrolase [Saprospiraceae bacterium]|nr:alpha/beta hydrolase [Saprospiraceae bacterium]
MSKTSLTLLLFIFLFTSCQESSTKNASGTIAAKVGGNVNRITLGEEQISVNEEGSFIIKQALDFSTILRLNVDGEDYEIFLQPGSTVELNITADSISFLGDLVQENQHLVSDRRINKEVDKYLSDNWYTLHRKAEDDFIHIIDSIRGVYLSSLEQRKADLGNALSDDFVKVNRASVEYSFDRLLIRYPEWHHRFTGQKVAPNSEVMKKLEYSIDRPEFLSLETYKKCANTWLGLKMREQRVDEKDQSIYLGQMQTQSALSFVAQQFRNPALKDYWSFQFIQDHLEQYTWINGNKFLQDFISNCQTDRICEQAKALEAELLAARKGHEIQVYKSEKGLQLEAHIFKPEPFDSNSSYPALAAFHGGGWMAGHADWTFGSAKHAAENGMIGIAVEYRLSNRADITPVEAMEDTRDAIRWIRTHSKSLSIDKNRIVGKGLSAGGHLISSISVLQEEEGEESSVPNALVLVSPAIDTQEGYFKSLLQEGTDASGLSALENLQSGQQIPPTLILQGRTDRVTPTSFAEQFKQKMDSLNYDCQLKVYENCGHIFTPSHLDDTGMPMPDPEISKLAFEEQVMFLKERNFIR